MFPTAVDLSTSSICLLFVFFVWYCSSSVRAWYRLRHIPPPSILATFSYLWLAKTTYSGKQYWIHRDLHRKYGPLVRVGPKEVFTDDPEIIKKISGTQSLYSRDSWYSTGRFNPYHENLFTILEPGPHKKAKARLAAAYSGRENPTLEHRINDQVKTLIEVLHKRYLTASPEEAQPLVNLGTMSCYFTMDVITCLAFGEEVGYLRDEKDHYSFLGSVRELWPRMSTSADVPWIRSFLFSRLFLKLLGPKSTDKAGFGALMGVAEQHVSRRFAPDMEKQNDMLGTLISRGFSRQECEVEGLLMLLAGTESTACAIRAAVVHIIASPNTYQRLKEEIKLAIQEGRASSPILMQEAIKLPYLQAVVFESIRMRPPLLGLFPKVVPAPGDFFHGKYIPAGTSICMNVSAILRSQALFGADVDVFRPERFLALDEEKRRDMERDVGFAFGYGQWGCAGKSIALMEINKVIFELLRKFDIQVMSPMKPSNIQSYGVFLETDLSVKLTKDLNLSAL